MFGELLNVVKKVKALDLTLRSSPAKWTSGTATLSSPGAIEPNPILPERNRDISMLEDFITVERQIAVSSISMKYSG